MEYENKVIELLMGHRTVRNLRSDPVSDDIKKTIIRCGQMAPTSSHFQAYSIIDIKDPAKRSALCKAAGGQKWLETAPIALLFCADLHRGSEYFTLEDPQLLRCTESYTVAVVDAALAAQKTLIAAQSFGLGGVIVGGVRNDMQLMKEIFQLPELVMPLFVLTLGYYDETPILRPRLPYEVVVKEDVYNEDGNKEMIAAYDDEMRDYFAQTSLSGHMHTWTEASSYYLSVKPRYELTRFVKEQGFLEK